MVIYIKGDLFDAPNTQLLVHACNCQGMWGSGVAKEFRSRFGEEFHVCKMWSQSYKGEESLLLGTSLVINRVGCLFTSVDYGPKVDPPDKILLSTKNAMDNLLS